MAIKTHLLIFLSLAIVALSIANAETLLPNPIFKTAAVIINGTLYCSLNGGYDVNGTATPPFPNALVQLRNQDGKVLGSTITAPNGGFNITSRPGVVDVAATIAGRTRLYVATPLVQCNPTLPSDRRLVSTRLVLNRYTIYPPTIYIVPDGFTDTEPF